MKQEDYGMENQEEMLKNWKQLVVEEDGMGTVEIILIVVVLVGLVLIFKEQITTIVNSIFDKITKQTNKF
jgi:Flp pilus assembly pilin Flp